MTGFRVVLSGALVTVLTACSTGFRVVLSGALVTVLTACSTLAAAPPASPTPAPAGSPATQAVLAPTTSVRPSPATDGTMLYRNETYGFRLTLPARGTVIDQYGLHPGDCGRAIADREAAGMRGVQVDNLLFIQVVPWTNSIRAYVDATEPQPEWIDRLYTLQPLPRANADEAVLPVRRDGVSPPPGYLPLGYITAAFRKGNRLFVLRPLQNPGTPGGCVAEMPDQLPRIASSVVFDP